MPAKPRDDLASALEKLKSPATPRWLVERGLTGYDEARRRMRGEAEAIHAGRGGELVWLVEHPPLYTAGTSADPGDLLQPGRFPVHESGRGGQYTYHGPGQRVAYAMLDLRQRGRDVRAYVTGLEEWVITALAEFGVRGERREDRVGVWVRGADGREAKIAAIGVRVSRWVTRHGIALNVHPDLEHYSAIVPCGVRDHGVTSLRALGVAATMAEVDAALKRAFARVFVG